MSLTYHRTISHGVSRIARFRRTRHRRLTFSCGERQLQPTPRSRHSRWTFQRTATAHRRPPLFSVLQYVPDVTQSIGILAALITQLEANPHAPALHRNDTLYEQIQCLAAHSPDFTPHLAKLARKSQTSDKALAKLTKELERSDPLFKATAGTTQAVDVIRGGVKTNALPENAYVVVNHRIAGYRYVLTTPRPIPLPTPPLVSEI